MAEKLSIVAQLADGSCERVRSGWFMCHAASVAWQGVCAGSNILCSGTASFKITGDVGSHVSFYWCRYHSGGILTVLLGLG